MEIDPGTDPANKAGSEPASAVVSTAECHRALLDVSGDTFFLPEKHGINFAKEDPSRCCPAYSSEETGHTTPTYES